MTNIKRKTRKTRNSRNGRNGRGGMLNAAARIATTTASGVVQKAALEYGQRRGPKIISSGLEDPNSLHDPSLYLTGKKTASLKTSVNPELFTSKYTPETSQTRKTPINIFDENYNPNIDENYNPNVKIKKGLKLIGGKIKSKKSRNYRNKKTLKRMRI
jgi:hypothetical protein